jgi:ATP-dependent 26S proteasome regulatory subunit
MSGRYEHSLEHLLEELTRIDLLIRARVLQLRMKDLDGPEEFRGLYISEEEVDALLASRVGQEPWSGVDHPELHRLAEGIRSLADGIAEKTVASLEGGIVLRLERLATLFALSPAEVDTLLVCLAPELDRRYERLYAYLQNDVTRKRPGVDLTMNLIYPSFRGKLEGRRTFAPSAPLVYWYLLRLLEEPPAGQAPLLAKSLKVDDRIVSYLLGGDECDVRLSSCAHLVHGQGDVADWLPDAEVERRLLELARRRVLFYFQGSYGVGRKRAAQALCRELGQELLVVDLNRMLGDGLPLEFGLRLAIREALLQGAAVYWDHFEVLFGEDRGALRDIVVRGLEGYPVLSFLGGEGAWEPVGALHEVPLIRVEFPIPAYEARRRLWETQLDGHLRLDGDVDVGALANKFRFSGGQIRDAVATARNLALGRGEERIAMRDVTQACRSHSNQRLTHLARKVRPHHTWADIVLPADQVRQLREIVNTLRHRPLVYGDWGFDRKLSLSKGLNALFVGPPGTGKTMAADILAGELALDLYKIDLSTVVSKYVGETEKNLNRIFKEAETSNSILFFDEADALFGRRSEVRDSHDRYANIEIAYLLQKMEEYDGIVILATNMRQNLDEAFVRRMHFTVEFPFPEEVYRRSIWEVTFPPEAPRGNDIDLDFLARKFKLAGGNIRNVILSAAFLAAEDGRVIGMEHLVRATKREFQKMGRLVGESDFGEYYEWASEGQGVDGAVLTSGDGSGYSRMRKGD